MTHEELLDFIRNRMRMAHIYQPVMLRVLLESAGSATERQIAEAISGEDPSQVEYYEKITRDMVEKVLGRHGFVKRNRTNRTWQLLGFEDLKPVEIEELITACQEKLEEYVESRGPEAIWGKRSSVSGPVRYEVLKRAKFRCDLCGVGADVKALQVDHIIPRSRDGSDDLSNLQALCYTCNATKGDRDDTDFREVRASYSDREDGCPFCDPVEDNVVDRNELALALPDKYPVTDEHTLIIPIRHTPTYFDLGSAEQNACNQLLVAMQAKLREQDDSIAGFNVAINEGDAAGQTIPHCHIHLIPRRTGDVLDPTGGVRNVIPGMGNYTLPT
jgi:diadenosine tetraphosphate (Ap4A) HIT family hydrolase